MKKSLVVYVFGMFLAFAAAPSVCADASEGDILPEDTRQVAEYAGTQAVKEDSRQLQVFQEEAADPDIKNPDAVSEPGSADGRDAGNPDGDVSLPEAGDISADPSAPGSREASTDSPAPGNGDASGDPSGPVSGDASGDPSDPGSGDASGDPSGPVSGDASGDPPAPGPAHRSEFVKTKNGLVYYDKNGKLVKGSRKIGKYTYYFNSKGIAHTGWRTAGKHRYYYDSKGRMAVGSKKVGKYRYYFKKNGVMHKNGFYTGGGQRYHSDKKGRLTLGSSKIGKYWYYFSKKTGAMHKGLLKRGKSTYYYDSKGHRYRGSKKIKGKWYYFESNGKRTTSKARILAVKVLEKRGWDLRAAFNYSAYSLAYSYTGGPSRGKSHTDWYAEHGFRNKRGNCYVMAATFVQMARVLGYKAYLVEGSVPSRSGGSTPHGWCEIVVNGATYVCDPDFTHETGRNGYMIRYRMPGTWVYSGYWRAN